MRITAANSLPSLWVVFINGLGSYISVGKFKIGISKF